MKNFSRITIFSAYVMVVIALAMLSGCAKYTPHTFSSPIGSSSTQNNVIVVASALTESDCRYYFSRRILNKGYQPIQLMIKNNTDQAYIMDAVDINLNVEDNIYVAHKLHLNPTQRFISWAIPGLFFGIFFIPAFVDTARSIEANNKLSDDFRHRTFGSDSIITIAPRTSINKVFFVRSDDFESQLTVMLRNKNCTSEPLIFDMNVN